MGTKEPANVVNDHNVTPTIIIHFRLYRSLENKQTTNFSIRLKSTEIFTRDIRKVVPMPYNCKQKRFEEDLLVHWKYQNHLESFREHLNEIENESFNEKEKEKQKFTGDGEPIHKIQ